MIFFAFSFSTLSQTAFQKDFAYYWQTVNDNFAYFNKQQINWEKVKMIYQPVADTVQSKVSLIHLFERMNNELYNGHVFLNTNTPSSNRLVPSGADMKTSYTNRQYIITEIREGFNAGLCGLQNGMTVTRFNDIPVETAVLNILPRSVTKYSPAMYEYAANFLLACLPGEIYSFETPETKIPFSFPCVQLQHINGQPREDYVPNVLLKDQKDAIKIAMQLLPKSKK